MLVIPAFGLSEEDCCLKPGCAIVRPSSKTFLKTFVLSPDFSFREFKIFVFVLWTSY